MTSIRRTLSPYHDRSQPNGSNNPFTSQSPSRKLFSNGRVNLSPLRRFLAELLVQKQQYSRKSNHSSWKKSLFRCSLFFIIGFLLGMASFNSDFFSEFKHQHLRNAEFSFNTKPLPVDFVEHSVGDVVVERPKETEIVVDTVELAVVERSGGNEIKRILNLVPQKPIIVVTPTYSRGMQAYYLNRLGQVLKLVRPPVLWIVVELNDASIETAEILRNLGIVYRHLVCTENITDVKDQRVLQRNTALEHIERHKLDGILYFADDHNIYSLELFESIRSISNFGTWPVGMLDQSESEPILEGPVCNGSQVIGWHTNEKSKRLGRLHVDMSGFAFNSTILWDPKRSHRPTLAPIRQSDNVKESFQEASFIEQIMEDESQMECLRLGHGRIMNWHLHLEAGKMFQKKFF